MGRFTRHGMDDQPLEGGGRGAGGGGSLLEAATKIGGPATLGFLGSIGGSEIIKNAREKREAEAEAEAKSRGKKDSMTPGQQQSMQEAQDAATQTKKDKAYKAAETYPDIFAKGGMTASKRGDGIAQRGKTKGTMIMCGGGMAKK
jgi:hypothetical protein